MIKQLIAAAALAGVAAVSHAAEPVSASFPNPFYVGVDAGATKVTGAADGNKTSYGIFAGYNFNSNFAVEAGFRRLYTWDAFGAHEQANQTSLSVIGTLPVTSNLGVYGRVGVNSLAAHGTWSGNINGTNQNFSYSDSTTHALLGLGVSYKLSDNVSARVEAQRPHSGLTNYSAGVSYSF